LRDDLDELIKFAKDKGFKDVELQTNGVLLSNRRLAHKISEAGVDRFIVSLHSHKKGISERITNAPGTFDKTLMAVKNLTELEKNIHISHVINSLNYRDLTNFLKFIKKRFPSVSSFYFSLVRPNGNAWQNKWIVPKISEIDIYIYQLFDYCRDNKIPFSVEGLPLCYMQGYEAHSTEVHRILSKPVFYIGSDTLRGNTHRFTLTHLKSKGEQCDSCFIRGICPGVWVEYAEIHGTGELFPIFENRSEVIRNYK
jgi:MoaA/NifB/PqqE/SkfB family radical SAM enzyme